MVELFSYVSNHPMLAVGAHIGLALPGEVGSFQREGKVVQQFHYLFPFSEA